MNSRAWIPCSTIGFCFWQDDDDGYSSQQAMKKLWKSWFLQHQNCNITPEVIPRNATGSKVWPFGKIKLTVGNSILRLLQQQQFAQIQQHSPHFKISEYKHDFNQNPPKNNRLSAALITKNPTRRFSQEQLAANKKYYVNVLSWSLSSRTVQQILVVHISVIILMTYVVAKQRPRSRDPRPSAVKLRFGKLMSDLYCRNPKTTRNKFQD